MALPRIFSRRKREASSPNIDPYVYHEIPRKLRIQVIHLIQMGLDNYDYYSNNAPYWAEIVRMMRMEKGVFSLSDHQKNPELEFLNWLLTEPEIDHALDGIELSFRAIKNYIGEYHNEKYESLRSELNDRFQESGIGYAFESGNIVQIENQITHKEIVIPALTLLQSSDFSGANDEYLKAHSFFRQGDHESCLIECGKALESVLKVIGSKRSWGIGANDTANRLIGAAFSSGFIPAYMQAQFTALRSVLESGVPTIRNRMSGHGTGATVRTVDRHLAAYQLHQTAAAIVFLVEHHQSLP